MTIGVTQLTDDSGIPIQGALELGSTTVVAYTGTAATSAALTGRVLRVVATTACFIKTGSNPTATTSDAYLPANTIQLLKIDDQDKISAIQLSSGGNLYATVLS